LFCCFSIPVCFGWSRVSSISRFPVRERRSLRASNSRRNRFHATHTHTHTHNDNLFVFYFCIHTLCVVKSPLWRERESKWADTANRLTIIYTHKNVKNSVAGRHLLCLPSTGILLYIIKEWKKKNKFLFEIVYSDNLLAFQTGHERAQTA
jgi:hypothetical protein